MKLSLAATAVAPLVVDAAGIGNFFTYYDSGGLGPDRWPFLAIEGNQCGGTQGASGFGQSPVTIDRRDKMCDTNMDAYNFMPGDCTWQQMKFSISNNGVKVEPKADAGCSFGQMNIPHTPNKFNALQFHIHTFSEHQIVGQGMTVNGQPSGYFPAELHVVHQEETQESFAVFGTMISVGPNPHEQFEWFLQGWEQVATQVATDCGATTTLPDSAILQNKVTCDAANAPYRYPQTDVQFPTTSNPNVYGLPTANEFGVYTYKGGLTTPACTEIVNWNLLDAPMEISQEQLDRLEYLILCFVQKNANENDDTIIDSCQHATVASEGGSTSRPPQPLLGRTVLHRCNAGPAVTVDDVGVLKAPGDDFVKPDPVTEPSNTDSNSKCSKALYESCSDDPRYNPQVSPNLKANADIWNQAEGYWVGTMKVYDNVGEPLLESFASEKFKNTLPYPRDTVQIFMNRTIRETRYYEHVYHVYRPADAALFCTFAVPEESANVLGSGTCGVNGYADVGEQFGTATFEKDGTASIFFSNGRYSASTSGQVIPVDKDTFYSTIAGDDFEYSETDSFSNAEKTRLSGSGQFFIKSNNPPYSENPLAESYVFEMNQVTVETFTAELEKAYVDNAVLMADQQPVIAEGNCVDANNCPTEDDFRMHDPLYNSSPYQQDERIKGGFIALFVILIVLALVGLLVSLHLYRFHQQAERYKHQFARRVAETIQVDGHQKLTPENLEQEFAKMDADGNGTVDKEELREFMGDKMSPRDFDVMFAAIDLDRNGTVDFTEFCAFMAQIGAIYDDEQHKVPAAAAAKKEDEKKDADDEDNDEEQGGTPADEE